MSKIKHLRILISFGFLKCVTELMPQGIAFNGWNWNAKVGRKNKQKLRKKTFEFFYEKFLIHFRNQTSVDFGIYSTRLFSLQSTHSMHCIHNNETFIATQLHARLHCLFPLVCAHTECDNNANKSLRIYTLLQFRFCLLRFFVCHFNRIVKCKMSLWAFVFNMHSLLLHTRIYL